MKPDFSYNLTHKVDRFIKENNMIGHGDLVVVGLSGGADSVCLFLLLNKLKTSVGFTLHAVHVHHGLRGISADRDEQFSKELCEKYDVPYESYFVDVKEIAKDEKLSVEEAGRSARYAIFEQYVRRFDKEYPNVKVAIAHHMNDQAETVIFNMVRGSGLKGISGISPVNDRKASSESKIGNEITLIRPLLCITRTEIEQYLSEANQNYCTDETNSDNNYSRNLIRNEVIETLNILQPKSPEHISLMADDARDALRFIEEYVSKLYSEAVSEEIDLSNDTKQYVIDVKMVKEQSPYIVKELIIFILKRMIKTYKDITKNHITDIYNLINKGKGKKIMLPYNLIAEREKSSIKIYKG